MGLMDRFKGRTAEEEAPRPAKLRKPEKEPKAKKDPEPEEPVEKNVPALNETVKALTSLPAGDLNFDMFLRGATVKDLEFAVELMTEESGHPLDGHKGRVRKVRSQIKKRERGEAKAPARPPVKYPEREDGEGCGAPDPKIKNLSRALRDGVSNEVYTDAFRLADEVARNMQDARASFVRAERILKVSKMIGALTEREFNEVAGTLFDFISAIDKSLPDFDGLFDQFLRNWR